MVGEGLTCIFPSKTQKHLISMRKCRRGWGGRFFGSQNSHFHRIENCSCTTIINDTITYYSFITSWMKFKIKTSTNTENVSDSIFCTNVRFSIWSTCLWHKSFIEKEWWIEEYWIRRLVLNWYGKVTCLVKLKCLLGGYVWMLSRGRKFMWKVDFYGPLSLLVWSSSWISLPCFLRAWFC